MIMLIFGRRREEKEEKGGEGKRRGGETCEALIPEIQNKCSLLGTIHPILDAENCLQSI